MRTALLLALALATPAPAQDAASWRFRFAAGDVLTYRVEQSTTIRETTLDDKTSQPTAATMTAKLAVTRRWEVKDVVADGSATLEMTVAAMRQEITRPGPADAAGNPTVDTVVLDSATDEGAKQLAAVVGKVVMTVKTDALGRLQDVQVAGGGKLDGRAKVELPFRLTLPEVAVAAWQRPAVALTLDPPIGAGEKLEVRTAYTAKGAGVVALKTTLHEPPADAALLPGLVPLLWAGDVRFDPAAGRYLGADLSAKEAVPNHQGAGTRFEYESTLSERLEGK